MILALVGTDAELQQEILAFLVERSLRHVDVARASAGGTLARRLAGLRDTNHHVMTGLASVADLELLRSRPGVLVLFLGPRPAAGTPAAELHGAADDCVDAGDGALERARAVALRGMREHPRPGWDEYFMEIAHVVARRSNCMKRKVAAVIVIDRRVISTGYNGTPRGALNCDEGGCPRCNALAPAGHILEDCMCNHAEENAIVQAAYHGTSVRGGTLYCTYSPCLHCTKLIINAGLSEVVYDADYPMGSRSLDLLGECGVAARKYAAG